MEKIELEANKRVELGKKLKKGRNKELIPAIVYGQKIQPIPLFINRKLFTKNILGSDAGMNAIISLKVADEKGKALAVLTHEIQRNPLNDEIIHIDFRHISMDEAIKTRVPIELIGLPLGGQGRRRRAGPWLARGRGQVSAGRYSG